MLIEAYRGAGGRLPFEPHGAFGGAPFEGYFWRFTQKREPQVVIVLVGIINKERSLCAMAWHPGGSPRQVIVEAAEADRSRFGVRVGGALAGGDSSLRVDLDDDPRLEVRLSEQTPYPPGRLGALGLGSLVPNLAHYWQPILLGGRADGELRSVGEMQRLENARVYAERTWGTGFPEQWWWGQADRFESADVCLAFAGGPLTLVGLEVAPTALVLRIGKRVLAFAPPLSATRIQVAAGTWRLRARTPRYRLEVEGDDPDETATLLPVPAEDGRRTELRAAQTLAGRVRVTLSRGPQTLFRGESSLAGLEQAAA